jgi:hypothetical protein
VKIERLLEAQGVSLRLAAGNERFPLDLVEPALGRLPHFTK